MGQSDERSLHRIFLSNGEERIHKWLHYFDIYERHLARPDAREQLDELTAIVKSSRPVCLLCYERDVAHCHRRRIAELICERTGIEVEHLAAPLF